MIFFVISITIFESAMQHVHQTLQWTGKLVLQLPMQTLAVLQNRLIGEASTGSIHIREGSRH